LTQLNITLEIILGIETDSQIPDDHSVSTKANTPNAAPSSPDRRLALKRFFTTIERTIFTIVSVAISILVPEFSSMMAFLGSFSAFLLCVIGPVSAKVALNRHCSLWDAMLLLVAVFMAVWGTAAAFWSTTEGGV
jgi:solute carrier family 32 (vesicular inhibitory amino acid transporter)